VDQTIDANTTKCICAVAIIHQGAFTDFMLLCAKMTNYYFFHDGGFAYGRLTRTC